MKRSKGDVAGFTKNLTRLSDDERPAENLKPREESQSKRRELRGTFPYHPLSNILPLLEGRQFEELVEDIRRHGLRQPIVLLNGAVLDGRNRLRACVADGVPYRTVPFDGTDPLEFVISANLRRRHLSTSQRSMVAAEIANMRQGARTDIAPDGAMSQSNAARLLNVSRRSVQRAAALRESAGPTLVGMIKRGEVTVHNAAALVELPKASGPKIGTIGTGEIPSTAEQSRPNCDVGPQAASAKEGPNARPRTRARRTAIRVDPLDLFPDLQSECAIKDARQRNKRSRWLPQTGEEQFAECLTNLFNSDDWQQVSERLRGLNPKEVVRASKKGPMLRVQR
jgi:ParB-like chromosome segregation protein Spo0J